MAAEKNIRRRWNVSGREKNMRRNGSGGVKHGIDMESVELHEGRYEGHFGDGVLFVYGIVSSKNT